MKEEIIFLLGAITLSLPVSIIFISNGVETPARYLVYAFIGGVYGWNFSRFYKKYFGDEQ